MKRSTLMVLGIVASVAATAQAGRSSDYPAPARDSAASEAAARAEVTGYTGRPNESVAMPSIRTEGEAEFAVMTTGEGGGKTGGSSYNGRPLDYPAR